MYKETVMSREKFAKVTGLSPDCQYMYDAALPELEAQAKITWDIAEKAGYEKGVKAQKTPRTDLECELADEEFRREFRIARKDTDMEMYKAGIQKVVEWVENNWKLLRPPSNFAKIEFGYNEWQAFLKEVEKC